MHTNTNTTKENYKIAYKIKNSPHKTTHRSTGPENFISKSITVTFSEIEGELKPITFTINNLTEWESAINYTNGKIGQHFDVVGTFFDIFKYCEWIKTIKTPAEAQKYQKLFSNVPGANQYFNQHVFQDILIENEKISNESIDDDEDNKNQQQKISLLSTTTKSDENHSSILPKKKKTFLDLFFRSSRNTENQEDNNLTTENPLLSPTQSRR